LKGVIRTRVGYAGGTKKNPTYHDLDDHTETIQKEFELMYPGVYDYINSTAAARVNGYLGGHGTYKDLQAEINDFGLSQPASRKLLDMVRALGR